MRRLWRERFGSGLVVEADFQTAVHNLHRAPVGEQDTFRKILGIGPLSTDEDLRSALDQVETRIKAAEAEVGEMYPNARQAAGPASGRAKWQARRQGGGQPTASADALLNKYGGSQ